MSAPPVLAAALGVALAVLAMTRLSAARAVALTAGSLLALAAAFFAVGAAFAGALQIIVYVGAIVIVFVFAVTGLDEDPALADREAPALARGWPVPALVAAGIFVPFLSGIGLEPARPRPVAAEDVGALLFGPWAVAVELASFLLLVAILGVRHLGRIRGRDT